jgi:hypothetical protein
MNRGGSAEQAPSPEKPTRISGRYALKCFDSFRLCA